MIVKLLTYTRYPELTIAKAMRGCRSTLSSYNLHLTTDDIARLIRLAIKERHESVLEHASFTFSISGVSRVTTHQLVRHRIASYSQQSLRVIAPDTDSDWYIIPNSIQKEAREKYKHTMKLIGFMYKQLTTRYNISKEDARYILPEGIRTNITTTMNARELRHFFRLRCSPPAQWEIRELANKMLRIVKDIAPNIFYDMEIKE